jgi:hypothetical protein
LVGDEGVEALILGFCAFRYYLTYGEIHALTGGIINYMIEITQKLIQIGSSEGMILSKKDITRLGAKLGDTLKIRVELVKESGSHEELLKEYNRFTEKYGQTLKNLADR